MLNSIGEGVCILDAAGRTTFANRAASELTGYGVEEPVGEAHHALLQHSRSDGRSYSPGECPLCGAFREGIAHQTSNEVFWSKDGSMLPVGYTSDPVVEDGDTVGAIVIFRDVSARRWESEELQERFKTLLQESVEGLVLTDGGKVSDANKAFLETFGYEYEEVVGMEAGEFVVPEDREAVFRRVSAGKMETYEVRGLRKDGASFPAQVQPRNLPYDGREVRITSVLDITDRKRYEEELLRQRDLYEGMLSAQSELGEGFVIIDDQIITYANEAFCEISGYSLDEIEEMHSFIRLISEEDRAGLLERRKNRMETGEGDIHYETGLRHKDGRRLDVEVAFKVFEGEPLRFMIIVRDITRRKRTEENLRKQETRLRRLVEQAADALFVHDLQGDLFDVNQQACESLGYTREELIGMTVYDIEQNIDPRGFEGLWADVLSGGPVTIEGAHRRKDGTSFPVEVRIGLFEVEEGQLMLAAARDITERKEVEKELRRSERSLVEAQRIANFGNWEYDLREDEARWSEELYRIFGHEPRDFAPKYKTFFEAVHPEDREAVRNDAQRSLEGGGSSGVDFRIVRLDGEERTVHALYEVVLSPSGRPRKMVGTVHDVTERRRAEEALRQSEERFRSLVQNASDIIAIFEPDGEIRYVSPPVRRMLGYAPEELMGTTLMEYVHPEDTERVWTAFAEGFDPSASAGTLVEARCRHADGTWRYLEVIGTNMIENPSVNGMVVNARDITERKEYETELERSNAELQQFAYVASHDLQEPLRMISSYVQLLERRYKDQLDQAASEFIGYAVDGASRMQTLINDLLSYSRVGTRGRELAPTELSAVVEAAMANLRLSVEESGARVTSEALPSVMGDRPQLGQLFQNLIGNALKFRGTDTPEIHIGAERKGNEWLISVSDNGIGMEPQNADEVCVIFKRLHGQGKYSGTGIGLAICKRIVERHGGNIWVESEPDKGSAFYFTLLAAE